MIDLTKLKDLRQKTGVSFSLCKKALEESKNDIDRAKKLLNKWGAEKINEKSQRSTTAGSLFSYLHHNKKVAVIIELLCETDFVSNNQEFQNFGLEISMQIASMNAKNVDALLKQEYIRDPSKKINDLLKELVLKFGENIKISRFLRWELGQK